MKKPTKKEIKFRNQEWANDLRANKRKNTGCMLNKNGGRCCLMVAVDTAIRLGLKTERPKSGDDYTFPDDEVVNFFGWDGDDPNVVYFGFKDFPISYLNDGNSAYKLKPMSHKEIAKVVEDNFVNK